MDDLTTRRTFDCIDAKRVVLDSAGDVGEKEQFALAVVQFADARGLGCRIYLDDLDEVGERREGGTGWPIVVDAVRSYGA